MRGDEKVTRGGWKCVARGLEMRGDAGMTTSGRGRDYVGTRQRLRRDAAEITSGRGRDYVGTQF